MHVRTYVVRCEGLVVYGDLQATDRGLQVRVSAAKTGGRERLVGVLPLILAGEGPAALTPHEDLPGAAHAALQREILEALG